LGKLIDASRAHIFDIITQYRAIFSDDQPGVDGGVLYGWIMEKISSFMQVLSRYLFLFSSSVLFSLTPSHTLSPQSSFTSSHSFSTISYLPLVVEGSSIATVLDQCMYYGMSLGRVGVDFRSLLSPVFENHIYTIFVTSLDSAVEKFSLAIRAHRWNANNNPHKNLLSPSSYYLLPGENKDPYAPPPGILLLFLLFPGFVPFCLFLHLFRRFYFLSSSLVSSSLPSSLITLPFPVLLEYPSVALLVNGFLTTFNELRQCAPLSLQQAISEQLEREFNSIVTVLVLLRNETHLNTEEEKAFSELSRIVSEIALPYLLRCCSRVFLQTSNPLFEVSKITSRLAGFYETPEEEGGFTTSTDLDVPRDKDQDQDTSENVDYGADDDEEEE
jgi:hypothetical protein